MHPAFSEKNFHRLCDTLARKDAHIEQIIQQYGYPPLWSREPSFETLVQIILEQQVSLASARAAMVKLKEKIGKVTPAKILLLTDDELKACYFSRQKTAYTRCLADAVRSRKLAIATLCDLPDEEIRNRLICIKGIGNWTVDVFLMMVLHRNDLFPGGDIALLNSVRHVKQMPNATKEEILQLAETWEPYRTIAAFLFWHAYIKRKKIAF